jgi:hypothetical protein
VWPAANRAAMEPPSEAPTSTGGAAQVRSMSSPSQASAVSAPGGPSSAREAPRPGRSGATTWCAPASPAMTGSHMPAQPPCPCSSTTGGPFPGLQHGGGHPGQPQPPFGDGGAGQEPLSEVVGRGPVAAVLHGLLSAHR